MKEKLVTVFGTRPEIIRLSRILPKLDDTFEHISINTYQNFLPNLNDIFLDQLKIRQPDYNLKISHKNYGQEIGDIIRQTHEILLKEKPDKLLILGDTYSCLSVMPASNLGIKIYHMEAGMRSGDFKIPEEKNRKIVDHLSTINLPYTEYSRQNLIREGLDPKKIFVTGNPIIEVLNHYNSEIEKSTILKKFEKDYVLVTMHRHENVTNPITLTNVMKAVDNISRKYEVIFFAHPRLLEALEKHKIRALPNVRLRKTVGFFDFVKLQKNAKCVLSDSGTVPEECAYLKVPCITLRNVTERQEFVDLGTNTVVGTKSHSKIFDAVQRAISSNYEWKWNETLGDGKTSERVIRILEGVL